MLPVQLAAEGELNAARRLAEQDRWDLALPMLQALLEGSPQALVHSDGLYRPLGRVVNDLLSDCPPEALRNYALLYGPAARKLYERGVRERSAALLREASVRYLHTPSGVRAAGALAGILMDEGRFASALLVLSDTDALSLTAAEQAPIAARRIICLAHLGRRGEADRRRRRPEGRRGRLADRGWQILGTGRLRGPGLRRARAGPLRGCPAARARPGGRRHAGPAGPAAGRLGRPRPALHAGDSRRGRLLRGPERDHLLPEGPPAGRGLVRAGARMAADGGRRRGRRGAPDALLHTLRKPFAVDDL